MIQRYGRFLIGRGYDASICGKFTVKERCFQAVKFAESKVVATRSTQTACLSVSILIHSSTNRFIHRLNKLLFINLKSMDISAGG